MIRDLDDTIQELLGKKAEPESELAQADVSFDLPDAEWRAGLEKLNVNCYLYDIQENPELRTNQPILQRSADGESAVRRRPPARIDCAYCITAWSPAANESVLEEHRLLSQVLKVLLKNPIIPPEVLQGELAGQIPPYPTVIASPNGVKNQPEFWGALDQQLKPSLNYVVTLAILLDEPGEMAPVPKEISFEPDQPPAIINIKPAAWGRGQAAELAISGRGTGFSAGSAVSFSPDAGITVNETAAVSAERLIANIAIHPAAPEEARTVTVTTGRETVSRRGGFRVTPPPLISAIDPAAGDAGQALNLAISGQYTHFDKESAVTFDLAEGIMVNSLTAVENTRLVVTITIAGSAPQGKRAVTVASGGEIVIKEDGFEVE